MNFFRQFFSPSETQQSLLKNSHLNDITEGKEGDFPDHSSVGNRVLKRRNGVTAENYHNPLHARDSRISVSERESGLIKDDDREYLRGKDPPQPDSTHNTSTGKTQLPPPPDAIASTAEAASPPLGSSTENLLTQESKDNHHSVPIETSQKVYIFGSDGKSKSSPLFHKEKIVKLLEKYFHLLYERNQDVSPPAAAPAPAPATAPEPAPVAAPAPAGTTAPNETTETANNPPTTIKFNAADFKPTIISTQCRYKELDLLYPCFLSNFAVYILVFSIKDLLYRPTHKRTVQDLKDYFDIIHTHVFEDYYARIDEGKTVEVTPKIIFIGTEDDEFSSTTSWMHNLSSFWESPNPEEKQKWNVIHRVFRNKQDIYHQVHEILRFYFHQEKEYNEIVPFDQEMQLTELFKDGVSGRSYAAKKYNFFPLPTTNFAVDEFLEKIFSTPKNRIWNPFQSFFIKSAASHLSMPVSNVLSNTAEQSLTEQGNQPKKSDRGQYLFPKQAKNVNSESGDPNDFQLILKNPGNVLQLTIEEDRYRMMFNIISDFFSRNSIKVQEDSHNETLLSYYQGFLLQSTSCVLPYDKWIKELKEYTHLPLEKIVQGTSFLATKKLLFHIRDHTESVIWHDEQNHPEYSCQNHYIVLRPFHYCFQLTEKVLLIKRIFEKDYRNLPSSLINHWETFFKNSNYRQQLFQQGLIPKTELLTNALFTEQDLLILQFLGILSPMIQMEPQINHEPDVMLNAHKEMKTSQSMRKLSISKPESRKEGDHYHYLFPYFPKIHQQNKAISFAAGSRFYFLLGRQTNKIITSLQKFEWNEAKEHAILPSYLFQRFIHRIVSSQLSFLHHYNCQSLYWNPNNYSFFENHCMMTLYSYDVMKIQESSSCGVNDDRLGHMPFSLSNLSPEILNLNLQENHYANIKIFVNPNDRIIQIEVRKNWENVFLIHRYLLQQMKIVLSEFYSYLDCIPLFELPSSFPNTLSNTGQHFPSCSTLSGSKLSKREDNILLIPLSKLADLIILGENRFRVQEFSDHGIPIEFQIDQSPQEPQKHRKNARTSPEATEELGKKTQHATPKTDKLEPPIEESGHAIPVTEELGPENREFIPNMTTDAAEHKSDEERQRTEPQRQRQGGKLFRGGVIYPIFLLWRIAPYSLLCEELPATVIEPFPGLLNSLRYPFTFLWKIAPFSDRNKSSPVKKSTHKTRDKSEQDVQNRELRTTVADTSMEGKGDEQGAQCRQAPETVAKKQQTDSPESHWNHFRKYVWNAMTSFRNCSRDFLSRIAPSYIGLAYLYYELCCHFVKEFYDYHKLQQESHHASTNELLFVTSTKSSPIPETEETKIMNVQLSPFYQYIHPEDIQMINSLKSFYNSYFRFVKYYELASCSLPRYSKLIEKLMKVDYTNIEDIQQLLEVTDVKESESKKVKKSLFTIFVSTKYRDEVPPAGLFSNLVEKLKSNLDENEKVRKEFYYQFSKASEQFEYVYVSLPFYDPPEQPVAPSPHSENPKIPQYPSPPPSKSQSRSQSRSESLSLSRSLSRSNPLSPSQSLAQWSLEPQLLPQKSPFEITDPKSSEFEKELEYLLYSHTIYYFYSYTDLVKSKFTNADYGSNDPFSFNRNIIIYQWIFLVIFMKYYWNISHLKYFTMIVFDYPTSKAELQEKQKSIHYFFQLFSADESRKEFKLTAFLPMVKRLMTKYCGELHRAYNTLGQRSDGIEGIVTLEQILATCDKICYGSLDDLIYQVSEIIDLMNENPIKFKSSSMRDTMITKPCFVVTPPLVDSKWIEAFCEARAEKILLSLALEYIIPPPPPPPTKFYEKEKKITNKWIQKYYPQVINFIKTFGLVFGSIVLIMFFQSFNYCIVNVWLIAVWILSMIVHFFSVIVWFLDTIRKFCYHIAKLFLPS